MKIQETIENLKYLISGDCTDNQMDFIEEIEMAINALEKQIPKKPKKKEESQYSTFYDCPCCGGYLVSKIDGELCGGQKFKYCYRCGQALDWNDHPTEKGGERK